MKTSKADKYFSLFIRLRDADENGCAKCCTCGAYKPIKEMDCGHFIKRQHMATRFSELNCHTQCKRCNGFEQGRDSDFERYLNDKIGLDKVNNLKLQARMTRKISNFELEQITKYYKTEAEKLAQEKNLKLWG